MELPQLEVLLKVGGDHAHCLVVLTGDSIGVVIYVVAQETVSE